MSKTELSLVPAKRKEYLKAIGKLLVSKHGKKTSYRIKAIQQACNKSGYKNDFAITNFPWIACVFAEETAFNDFCKKSELVVDYSKMRKKMLKGMAYDKILNSKESKVKGKIDINSTSVSNLIDPHIIGDV